MRASTGSSKWSLRAREVAPEPPPDQPFAGCRVLMNEEADGRLVARCCEGDRRAFADLVSRYQKPIYNAAMHMLHHTEDARDVTQTVFLKAYEHLDAYDPKFKFYSWIYRIALNESINALQRRRRSEPLTEQELDEHDGPDDEVGSAQVSRRVQAALMTLRPDYRAVIVLKHFLDSSNRLNSARSPTASSPSTSAWISSVCRSSSMIRAFHARSGLP